MPRPLARFGAALAASVLAEPVLAQAALAGTVVLSPMLTDGSANPKQVMAVHQLISSELEFSPGVDSVVDLPTPPPTLDEACLANAGCLGGITQANGGNQLLAGRVQANAGAFLLDLVFFDGSRVARRKTFQLPQDPTGMANAITPIVQEMLNGGGSAGGGAAVVAAAPKPSFDDELPEPAPAPPPPSPQPAFVAVPMAPAPVDPRLAAANGAQSWPPPAPPAPAPLPPPVPVAAPAVDPAAMISFATKPSDLSDAQVGQMIRFGPPAGGAPPAPMPVAMPAPPPPPPAPAPRPRANDTRIAEEESELAAMENREIVDLDDDGRRGRGSNPRATSSASQGGTTGTVASELGHTVQVTGRGGFCKYYGFNFVTGGAELGVAAVGGLHLVGGVEVYAVNRILPPEQQQLTGKFSEWNTIYPGNFGLLYKFPIGIAQPYVGADAIVVQYYKDEIGADWAGGARFRAGIDLMVVDQFGFNLNLAAGGWYGQNWPLIQEGIGAAGFLPQVSAGTVLAF